MRTIRNFPCLSECERRLLNSRGALKLLGRGIEGCALGGSHESRHSYATASLEPRTPAARGPPPRHRPGTLRPHPAAPRCTLPCPTSLHLASPRLRA